MATNERSKADLAIEKMNKRISDGITAQIEDSMRERFNGISGGRSSRYHCIYKVHEKLREVNKNAYTPELVSIGPLHNNDQPSLQLMQTHKLRYMKELFSNRDNSKLKECIESIRAIEKDVRDCYSEIPAITDTKFVEMMLLDGSFIIQLFLKLEKVIKQQVESGGNNHHQEDVDVFLLTNFGTISRDMVLLENQLPMLVLDKLYQILIVSASSSSSSSLSSVTEHALQFFKRSNLIVPEEYINLKRQDDAVHLKDSKHLLDLFGKTLFPEDDVKISVTQNVAAPGPGASRQITSIPVSIPCVTELRLAGVRFCKKETSEVGSFLDIEFKNATLYIPPLTITDQTETVFRNLIAYENCSHEDAYKITSYAFIMDRLIDSPDDIHYLCKKHIITNALGHNEAASSLFNKLCSEVTMGNKFYYSEICKKVNLHYKSSFNVWKADFKGTYCKNPWTLFSAVAAILLLLLTATQTTTAIIQRYSKHDNSSSSHG